MSNALRSALMASFASLALACSPKTEPAPAPVAVAPVPPTQAWPQVARPQPLGPRFALSGKIHVHDGDTIYVGQKPNRQGIRFWGVDAPELAQRCRQQGVADEIKCGVEARRALVALVQGQEITCEKIDEDKRRESGVIRDVAICYAGGVELNAQMVRQGWALDEGHYSKGYYAQLHREAEASKIGIWQYSFQKPSEWRKDKRKQQARQQP